MMKRLVLGIILIASFGAIAMYLFKLKNKPEPDSLYKSVPLDASWIVEIRNFQELKQNVLLADSSFSTFYQIPFLSKIYQQLRAVDSIQCANIQMNILFSGKEPILISGHSSEDILYSFRLNEAKIFRSIDEFIRENSQNIISYTVRVPDKYQITSVFCKADSTKYSYCWGKGIFMVSTSPKTLENALKQLSLPTSILDAIGFGNIYKTAGKNALANIFINLEKAPQWIKKITQEDPVNTLHMLGALGSWAELDFNTKPGIFVFNGFTFPHPIKPGIDALFREQQPVRIEVFNKLPASTNAFIVLGLSDLNKYMQASQQFSDQTNELYSPRDSLVQLFKMYDIDLEKQMQDLFENEACLAFANFSGDTLSNTVYSLIRINNRELAEKTFDEMIAGYAAGKELKPSEFVSELSFGQMQPIKIWSIPFGNVPALLFGKLFNAGANCYCTLLDNYLLFGNDPESLLRFIQAQRDKLLLTNDKNFVDFSEYFSLQSNFFFYNKPQLSDDFYTRFLSANAIKGLGFTDVSKSSLEAIVFQFSSNANMRIYNNLFLKFKPFKSLVTAENGKVISNEVELDTVSAIHPYLLKFNRSKETTVFVQDSSKKIYLIDDQHKIQWKRTLPEFIQSDVCLIDAFRNGKQQILFNTPGYIWLIDRNGNPVEGFPLKLKSKASCCLSVFDYDQNRKYRLLVGCVNKKVYCFDQFGKPVTGWAFEKTHSTIKQPIRLFNIEGKDFIVFTDSSRLYIIDRKGKEIACSTKPFPVSSRNPVFLINSRSLKDARFVVSDRTGKVHEFSVFGQETEVDMGTFPPFHFFDVFDFDADGVKDFIFTWGNNLKVFSQKKQVLFQSSVSGLYNQRPIFFDIKNVLYRLGVSSSNGLVYLFDPTGRQPIGFPISGSSQFTLDVLNTQENNLNLVVCSTANKILYYTVP